MYNQGALLTYYALTPIHMGTGTSVSYIDLPIQREKHTSFPMMAASGIKGVFRSFASRKADNDDKINKIFGSENGNSQASSVVFTDARILLYPVRSLKGIFAWITCPFVIKRFIEDLKSVNEAFNFQDSLSLKDVEVIVNNTSDIVIPKVIVNSTSDIVIPKDKKDKIVCLEDKIVCLEEFVFNVVNSNTADNLVKAIKSYLPSLNTISSFEKRVAIVSDDVFTDFVNYAIEVRTRIKIDQITGTVQQGALFTVEMVPSEAIFYSMLFVKPEIQIKDIIDLLGEGELTLQFGGDETIGLGIMRVKFNGGAVAGQ